MSFEDLYDASYERVLGNTIDGQSFFEAFYDNFLASSADIRAKFVNTDMAKQKKMLKKSFYSLLVFYGSNHADDYLNKIATSHNHEHLDIKPQFYDLWLDNLMLTARRFDPQFTDDVELAWRLVLTPGITYMKFKYDHS